MLELYKEGELSKKIKNKIPVINSIRGYLIDIEVLQLRHFPY